MTEFYTDRSEEGLPPLITEEGMRRAQENTRLLADASRRLRVPRDQVPAKLRSMQIELRKLNEHLATN